jgi:hypothetical protein
VERAPHRHIDRPPKTGHVGLKEQLAVAIGGVADRDVQAAELAHRPRHHVLHGCQIGYIGLDSERCGSRFLNDLYNFVGLVRAGAKIDDDARAGASQRDGGGPADSQAGSSDNCRSPF